MFQSCCFLRGSSNHSRSLVPISPSKIKSAGLVIKKELKKAQKEISKNPEKYYYDYIGKTENKLFFPENEMKTKANWENKKIVKSHKSVTDKLAKVTQENEKNVSDNKKQLTEINEKIEQILKNQETLNRKLNALLKTTISTYFWQDMSYDEKRNDDLAQKKLNGDWDH